VKNLRNPLFIKSRNSMKNNRINKNISNNNNNNKNNNNSNKNNNNNNSLVKIFR